MHILDRFLEVIFRVIQLKEHDLIENFTILFTYFNYFNTVQILVEPHTSIVCNI